MHPSAIAFVAALSLRCVYSASTAATRPEQTPVDLTPQGHLSADKPIGVQHHEASLGSPQGVYNKSEERSFFGADAAVHLLEGSMREDGPGMPNL